MSLQREDKLLNVDLILHKSGVGENMKVIDIGCGAHGHFVFPASKMVGKNGKVYAVDILKNSLENVKRMAYHENCHNIETIWSNAEIFNGLKLESGSIDVVLLINTLYQSKHRGAIMREASRILKKRGTMAVVDWKKVSLPFGPKPEDRVEQKHVIQIAQKLGLNLEEEFFGGNYHYGLIFQKI